MGDVYTCSVMDLNVQASDTNVAKVNGEHLDGKSNKDVLKLNIENQECIFLPHGFEKHFPNIEGLRVAASMLVELTQSDISVFPKLRNCDMFNNNIEVLERNLFEKNRDLEYLYFGDNRIRSVGYNILKPLTKIHTVVLQFNKCIDKNVYSPTEMTTFQQTLNEKCSTLTETDARKLNEIEEELSRDGKLSTLGLWIVSVLILITVVAAAGFVWKKRRDNKPGDTESIAGFLPAYNEIFLEATDNEFYDNGSTNLSRNNQVRNEPIS